MDAVEKTPAVTAPVVVESPESRPIRKDKPKIRRMEAFLTKLSARGGIWQRLASLVFLPYAFRSGIRMKRVDTTTFTAVLPFKRFNRNWYNAMAGAALLGNSEIASGMYLFGECGGGYSVVCKELHYKFLRPCLGPAVYRVQPNPIIREKVDAGEEFNVELTIDILQQIPSKPGKERRVGQCTTTFHATPKSLLKFNKSKTRRNGRKRS